MCVSYVFSFRSFYRIGALFIRLMKREIIYGFHDVQTIPRKNGETPKGRNIIYTYHIIPKLMSKSVSRWSLCR